MNNYKKSCLIALSIFLLTACLVAFIGLSVFHLTPGKASAAGESEAVPSGEAGSEEVPSSGEAASSVPSSEAQVPAPETGIHQLTNDELDNIEAAYGNEIKTFLPGDEFDVENRPVRALNAWQDLRAFTPDVRLFNAPSPAADTASFTFILNTENGDGTDRVLDILARYDVKALFFTTQNYVYENPSVISRILSEGHSIGSRGTGTHTDSLATYPLSEQMNDVLCFQHFMETNYGYTMSFFNFSGDEYSDQSVKLMTDIGYTVVFFTADYPEYDPALTVDPEAFLEEMEKRYCDGIIYSFHTVHEGTITMLPGLLSRLSGKKIAVTEIH